LIAHVRRLGLIALATGAALALAPQAFGAERSKTFEVGGWCYGGGTDVSSYRIALPARAADLRPTPQRGTVLVSADGETTARVVQIFGLRNGSRVVRWRVEELDCEPGRPWSIGQQTFAVRFRVLPRPVFAPKDCTKPRQRPNRIVIACADFGMRVRVKKWRTWGGRKARGRGVLRSKICIPSCAESRRFERFKVRLRLQKIRMDRCGGRRVRLYQRLVLSFPNKRPSYHKRIRNTDLYCNP
jgi:hypothetical protein